MDCVLYPPSRFSWDLLFAATERSEWKNVGVQIRFEYFIRCLHTRESSPLSPVLDLRLLSGSGPLILLVCGSYLGQLSTIVARIKVIEELYESAREVYCGVKVLVCTCLVRPNISIVIFFQIFGIPVICLIQGTFSMVIQSNQNDIYMSRRIYTHIVYSTYWICLGKNEVLWVCAWWVKDISTRGRVWVQPLTDILQSVPWKCNHIIIWLKPL